MSPTFPTCLCGHPAEKHKRAHVDMNKKGDDGRFFTTFPCLLGTDCRCSDYVPSRPLSVAEEVEDSLGSLPSSLTISEMQVRAHAHAVNNGFWSRSEDNVFTKLLLICSEVAEVTEVLRDLPDLSERSAQKVWFREDGKPEGVGPELSDIVIRVGDLAAYLGIDLEAETLRKMEFNETRPERHGGKQI